MLFIFICFLIFLFMFLLVIFRYGIFCGNKCSHRSNSFYKKDYLKKLSEYNPEPGFTIDKVLNKTYSDNIISYSIFGTNPKYFKNIINNIQVAKIKLPEWQIRVYIHNKVPKSFIEELYKNGAELYIVNDPICTPGSGSGTFWRFLPLVENVNAVILDADEKIDNKKVNNITYFFQKDKNMISGMGTSPFPKSHLMAGRLFKKKGFKLPWNEDFIMNYPIRSRWGSDEVFLTNEIYSYAKKQGLTKKKYFFDFVLRKTEPKSIYQTYLKHSPFPKQLLHSS